VSDYLTDAEQLARLRALWERYGTPLLVVLVLAAAAAVGWRWYQSNVEARIQHVSDLYAEFQQADGEGVILVSLRAGGTGISLQAADYVFILDPWWNPAVEDQAVDRVHRIGQTNNVFVYRMITRGTVEDRIQRLKAEKRELFDQVVGGFSPDFDPARLFGKLSALIGLGEDSESGWIEER